MRDLFGIKVIHKGSFNKLESWLNKIKGMDYLNRLDEYGRIGCEALASKTPIDTGLTAESWSYRIIRTPRKVTLAWYNSNKNKGVPIAIVLEYGHGCGNGTYVAGQHYINGAIKPVFDAIKKSTWEEVTKK